MASVIRSFLSISTFIFIFNTTNSQITLDSTVVDTNTIATGLSVPWEILWGPDNHIWMTERNGKISRLNPETGSLAEIADIPEVYEYGEGGLLGMVLHPDFESSPHVYVVYTYLEESNVLERLVRYTYQDESLISPVVYLDDITGEYNHIGSRLLVDSDNKLYMTTGDAAITSLSQNLNSLSGKVLRLNLDGTVPADNPIIDSYLWSWGLRNPQGLVIASNGIMYSSEHGPSDNDELNIIEKGRNYGWPNVRGFCDGSTEAMFCADSNVREPLMAWTPTLAVCGLDYYGHPSIPEWNGKLLLTSLKARDLRSIGLSEDGLLATTEDIWFDEYWGRLRDLCMSPDGRVFLAVSNKDGRGTPADNDDRIIEIKAAGSTNEYCFKQMHVSICDGDSIYLQKEYRKISDTYYDTIKHMDACDSIIVVELMVYDIPNPMIPEELSIEISSDTLLQAVTGFNSYMWNMNPMLNIDTLRVTGTDYGVGLHQITLKVIDGNSCIGLDTTYLEIIADTGNTTDLIITEKNTRQTELVIYPNPAGNEYINMEIPKTLGACSIRIYNLSGQVLFTSSHSKYDSKNQEIFIGNLSKGMYILDVKSSSTSLSSKFIRD